MNSSATAITCGRIRSDRDGTPMLVQIDEPPFGGNRSHRRNPRRGHVPGVIQCDEFGKPFSDRPPEVFTDYDKRSKRFTEAEAYAHAGMIIRTKRGLAPSTPVFPAGSYSSSDKRKTLTMMEFSNLVDKLTWNR